LLMEGKVKGEEVEKTLNVSLPIEEPIARIKEKSELSWWRKTDPDQDNHVVHNSPEHSPTPTTPTSPLPVESARYEFVSPSRVKLLTLNDVFQIPTLMSWNNNTSVKRTKDDFYRDTIIVSWDQTKESKRHKPNYPHLQKETRPSNPSKSTVMEFIGKQREVPPATSESTKKNGVSGAFIPRHDAQEFRPSKPQEDYLYRSQELLRKLGKGDTSTRDVNTRDVKSRQAYDDYSLKRSVKSDVHHLPHNYNDMHYSDYVDRGKYDYPSSRSVAARERKRTSKSHHLPHDDNIHADHQHYPHSGYSESRQYREDYGRGDPSREPYHRHYDRESVARVYYDKERLYHQQNSHLVDRDPRDRRHMHDMNGDMPEILNRYERRRREELEAYRYRDRGYPPSERINTYDEYERVVAERQRRQVYQGQQERRRSSRPMEGDYQQQDPRWKEYYRMKYGEVRRQTNAAY